MAKRDAPHKRPSREQMEERRVIPLLPDEFVKALMGSGSHLEGDHKPEGTREG